MTQTAKISATRVEKLHIYQQYTVQKGQWCCQVSITGLTSKQWDRLTSALKGRECMLKVSEYFGVVCTETTGQARQIAKAVERIGGKAVIARGKATFDVRGYYDDQGYDFVEADKA